MYVKIKNNEVIERGLPKTGRLSDGSWVSNYHLLPEETLLAEGWLPLVDEPPETDEKHRAVITGYEIFPDRVEAVYSIEEIIPHAPSEEELQDKARLKAQQLAVKSLIQAKSLSTEEIIELAPLFPAYEVGKAYSIGDVFTYKRSLYEVIQAHTSQADWPPDTTASLYKNHTPKGEIEEWRQPLGSHDAYMTGDRVLFNGKTYISKIDNNVWSPDTYGWELEASGEDYPAWAQPTGSHDDYMTGDIVSHNEQLWISTVDNNVWEPGVYGWETYTA